MTDQILFPKLFWATRDLVSKGIWTIFKTLDPNYPMILTSKKIIFSIDDMGNVKEIKDKTFQEFIDNKEISERVRIPLESITTFNIEKRHVYAVIEPHPLKLAPLALLHWDGKRLRHEVRSEGIYDNKDFESVLRKTLTTKFHRAEEKIEIIREKPLSLPELLYVQEGLGFSSIFYGSVITSTTDDCSKDFEKSVEEFFGKETKL